MSISGLSKYHEIRTCSIIFAKPGFMIKSLLILAFPSFRSLWLFPMCMLWLSPNCWSGSWASQDLVRPFTPRLLMNASTASCMTCAMHGRWFLKADHLIAEGSGVDCSSRVIEYCGEALSVVIPSKQLSVSSKRSSTSFKCPASLASVCWPVTYHSHLAFEMGKEQVINLMERVLNFKQCPISIHIVSNDRRYG